MIRFSFRYSRRCAAVYELNGRIALCSAVDVGRLFHFTLIPPLKAEKRAKMVKSTPRSFVYDRDLSTALTGKYRSVYDKIAAGSRVLEIGCSTGYFSQALIRKNCEVIAVDNDPDAVRTCQQRGIEAHHCDVGSAEFDNILFTQASYDYVLAMDVLEHLAAPHLLISALAKGMQQKAKLIVTGPNVAYWHVRWRLLQGRWEYTEAGVMDKTHLRWFTRATWQRTLG